MTIASEITRIQTNIANAYTAASGKGATLPASQNSDNLATCIGSISGGSTSARVFKANFWVDGDGGVHNIGNDVNNTSLVVGGGVLSANATTISTTDAYYNAYSSNSDVYKIDLSSLTTVSGDGAFEAAFLDCTSLTSVDLSSLTEISGEYAFSSAFEGGSSLTSIDLSSLTTVSGKGAFVKAFAKCMSLESISFPALTTTSFGNYRNQFENMLYETNILTTHTLHFPSNLQSIISGLTGYPNFGGVSGFVVLAFDLPATS